MTTAHVVAQEMSPHEKQSFTHPSINLPHTVAEQHRSAMSSTQDAIEDECNKDVCSSDTRSCETLKSLKGVRQSLDYLVTVFTRVSDDHESIRSNVADLWLTSMKLGTHARQLHEGLSRTTTSLQGTQTQLSNTSWRPGYDQEESRTDEE